MSLGVANKFELPRGARVIVLLVVVILFIQKRCAGCSRSGRAVEA
jgi:hypothetical protein